MRFTRNAPPADSVTIELEFTEAIGLYKLVLALNHPHDEWTQPAALALDEDAGPLAAALQVHLSGVVGP